MPNSSCSELHFPPWGHWQESMLSVLKLSLKDTKHEQNESSMVAICWINATQWIYFTENIYLSCLYPYRRASLILAS